MFGKLPYEEEKKILKEAFDEVTSCSANILFFPLIFNKEKTIKCFKNVKKKLEEVGV